MPKMQIIDHLTWIGPKLGSQPRTVQGLIPNNICVVARAFAAALLIPISTAFASDSLPNNVTTIARGSASYIDTIDFSYSSTQPVTFSQLKMCVAESINDDAAFLGDSAGSFVDSTRQYNQTNHSQVIQGGSVFKYVDDASSTLIAKGTVDAGSSWALSKDFIKFELKGNVGGSAVTLRISNISRAQQNTGSVTNDGFGPVGTWWGARSDEVYTALEGVANKLKACLR